MDNFIIKFDYNNMMAEYVGENGLHNDDFIKIEDKINKAKLVMKGSRDLDPRMHWRNLPYEQDKVVEDILAYVDEKAKCIDAFIVLGIGGSALGPMAVQQALNHPHYNELSREKRNNFPKFYIADNADPEKLSYLFDIVDPSKCLFNVISKSGSTSETMSQFMIIKGLLDKAVGKDKVKDHIVCTTDKDNGNLIKIAKSEGYKTFFIPFDIGGRFSELTPVGLLPAAFCGIDIRGLLNGAAIMDKACNNDDIYKNPAFMYGALQYIAMENGQDISVLMPYADSLKYISDWYIQLVAESLGKKYDSNGNLTNTAPTPIKALGATDQHSQLQLFVEGPSNKVVVFIGVEKYNKDILIPKIYEDVKSLGFLGGHTQSTLIHTEQLATEYSLLKSGKLNMTLTLPVVNANTVGQLLYLLEVAIAFWGELMGINTFDQPGVEESKNAAYAMFGRPGYEDKKIEIDNRPNKKDKYII